MILDIKQLSGEVEYEYRGHYTVAKRYQCVVMFEWQENNISRMSAENELDIVLSPRTWNLYRVRIWVMDLARQTNQSYCSKLNEPQSDFCITHGTGSSPNIAFDGSCDREQVWLNGKNLRIPATSEAPSVSIPDVVASVLGSISIDGLENVAFRMN